MNVTELARILKITPNELKEMLPQLGFNIGQKAIKVDMVTARRIIRDWPRMMAEWKAKFGEERNTKDAEDEGPVEKKEIFIPQLINVRDFAVVAGLSVNKVLAELMKNGVFVSMNEKIDFDTANIIGGDLNLDVKLERKDDEAAESESSKKLDNIMSQEEDNDLVERPPVIVVMGHVDHGKTKLLDAIRTTDVVAGEAGGITQHIGAYQVFRKDKLITFIDTPGHEAFTAMRSRGAKVADIAILVVAADDGVKPQTVEAFRIIEASKIPFIVAINKVDKPEADVNRTKQELSNVLGITPDDWGGKTVCVPVSAKEGTGVEDILDMVLLVAETEAESLKANPNSAAAGTIIEARVDKGAGPVATILVHNGTLRVGDPLSFNNILYGKVRSLKNYKGEDVEEIGPATPAKILGLKVLSEVGDLLEVAQGEKVKIKKVAAKQQASSISANEIDDESVMKLNLIIKSDVLGSAEAVEESLMKANRQKVKVKIISKGLGNISEGDIKRAEDNGAQILGFNVKIQPAAESMIRERGVKIKLFSIIYDLIEYAKEEMQLLIKPEIKRTELGELNVLAIFRSESSFQVIGGKVTTGMIENGCEAELVRNNRIINKGKIVSLQAGKQEVKEVSTGQECGMKYEGKPLVEVGDLLALYKEEKIIDKI